MIYLDKKIILRAKNDDKDALEELFIDLEGEMHRLAYIYAVKYRKVCSDENEYLSIIFDATQKTIEIYDESKGEFYHLWMCVIKRDISHFVKERIKIMSRVVCLDALDNDMKDNMCFSLSDFEAYEDTIPHKFYVKSESKKMIKYVRLHYSKEETELFYLWYLGYTFNEICAISDVSIPQAASKIYSIIKVLKNHFKE